MYYNMTETQQWRAAPSAKEKLYKNRIAIIMLMWLKEPCKNRGRQANDLNEAHKKNVEVKVQLHNSSFWAKQLVVSQYLIEWDGKKVK